MQEELDKMFLDRLFQDYYTRSKSVRKRSQTDMVYQFVQIR